MDEADGLFDTLIVSENNEKCMMLFLQKQRKKTAFLILYLSGGYV